MEGGGGSFATNRMEIQEKLRYKEDKSGWRGMKGGGMTYSEKINPEFSLIDFEIIRVGRNIDGFGLSPGITKDQRLGVESLMRKVCTLIRR